MIKAFYFLAVLVMISGGCRQTAKEELDSKFSQLWEDNEHQNSKEAIVEYTKVIMNDPNNSKAYYSRGKAKSHQEDYCGAISDYTKVIKITYKTSKDEAIYYDRGFAKYKLQDYLGAISDYTKGIEMNPDDVRGYLSGGLSENFAINKLKNDTAAKAEYKRLLFLAWGIASAYNFRGLAKVGIEDYMGAIDDYTKAIEINPKDSWAYSNRGDAKFGINDSTGAFADLDMAKELDLISKSRGSGN